MGTRWIVQSALSLDSIPKKPAGKGFLFEIVVPIAAGMTPGAPRVLIIGGNSAIARHLLTLLPEARAVARVGNHPRVTSVGDYRDLRAGSFEGVEAVINCAGTVRGTEAELREVNVELQVALAKAARDAGAVRYVTIGSFSIFGECSRIGPETPIAPVDAYGRSKRDGDQALQRLQTDRFGILTVAFPAIIGTTRIGKVERMLGLWRRTRIWPMPAEDIARSMIGAEGAARVLANAAGDDRTGRVLAADPITFGYRAVAQWLREDVGGTFGLFTVPDRGISLFRRASPSLYRSMMADSMLEPTCNYMVERGLESSLRRELTAAVIRGNMRR
ncbi:NAD-dependent epimerase/dehydratase family protein [Sphingomonas sp. DT-204]|uniref:NAD-dependent epimerase/dehydratase family protein n=1 Tax=Sphingomonas sp. DT-204 TaxID=3396166 RepID=UPI003F1DF840